MRRGKQFRPWYVLFSSGYFFYSSPGYFCSLIFIPLFFKRNAWGSFVLSTIRLLHDRLGMCDGVGWPLCRAHLKWVPKFSARFHICTARLGLTLFSVSYPAPTLTTIHLSLFQPIQVRQQIAADTFYFSSGARLLLSWSGFRKPPVHFFIHFPLVALIAFLSLFLWPLSSLSLSFFLSLSLESFSHICSSFFPCPLVDLWV